MTRPWVIAAALAVTACSDKAEEAQAEFRRLCDAIVTGQTTIRQASETFGFQAVRGVCKTDYAEIGGDDACPANPASVCSLVFQLLTNDCSARVGSPCADWCEVRIAEAATTNLANEPICARQWLDSQFILTAGPAETPAP